MSGRRRNWPAAFLITGSIAKLWPILWYDWRWTPLNIVRDQWRTPNGETVNLVEDADQIERIRPESRIYIAPNAHDLPWLTAEVMETLRERRHEIVGIPASDPHDKGR